mgnify:FL=1
MSGVGETWVACQPLIRRLLVGAATIGAATLAHGVRAIRRATLRTGTAGGNLELPVGATLVTARAGNSSLGYGCHRSLSVVSPRSRHGVVRW